MQLAHFLGHFWAGTAAAGKNDVRNPDFASEIAKGDFFAKLIGEVEVRESEESKRMKLFFAGGLRKTGNLTSLPRGIPNRVELRYGHDWGVFRL